MSIFRGSLTAALGYCVLALAAVPGISRAEDAPKNPSEVYGPAVQATAQSTTPTTTTTNPSSPYSATRRSDSTIDTLRYWNQISVDASGLDHTPVAAGDDRKFGEQLGPGRAARATAIVHIAMYDAVTAIRGGYRRYTSLPAGNGTESVDAAIAAAAHDTLVALYPSQAKYFDPLYAADIARLPQGSRVTNGVAIGKRAARLILELRAHDGAAEAYDPQMGSDWVPSNLAGHWRQDPIGRAPIAMGAHWGEVKPFVLAAPEMFRIRPPPAMNSEEYTRAYNEVKRLGGDGVHTPTERSADQTHIGIFWAYDGTPSLCAPPRLYNQVATQVSLDKTDVAWLARLYALINVSMADAGIASWESKYYYDVWRPVTGIREADPGTGPTGSGDGNPATIGDPNFYPLGAPASNLTGPNFTPPFPAYPSGHATFGGALFQVLRAVYNTDKYNFTFVSDEYNGVTRDNQGNVRPYLPRTFRSFSQAEEENGQSRIYLGIHWEFDKTQGIRQGRNVADYVMSHAFQPVK